MPLMAPRSLSPTRVNSFTDCPLAFRLRTIDRLPEPPSPHAVKGTLVHAALEGLIWHHPPGRRTPAAAAAELAAAWTRMEAGPELPALDLGPEEADELRRDAQSLVDRYFELEDPDGVRAVGVELMLETQLGDLRLRGIIDRLDLTEDGELVIVDYKTGKAPAARYEQGRLVGVHLYALLCRQVLGKLPVEVRLLHLRDPIVISAVPTDQTVRAQHQRTTAVWQAIERACERADFRPRPSPLCRYCHFQAWCPSFGGEPPPFDTDAGQEHAAALEGAAPPPGAPARTPLPSPVAAAMAAAGPGEPALAGPPRELLADSLAAPHEVPGAP